MKTNNHYRSWAGFLLLCLAASVLNQPARAQAPQFAFTNLAGVALGRGTNDGAGAAARFYTPFGLAVDNVGNIYVADTYNSTLRKVTRAGMVTTLAGSPLETGSVDGPGASARFFHLNSVTVDATGNLYIADSDNQTIRKVSPAGLVSTLAGSPRKSGSADGEGGDARFNTPSGVAVDHAGIIYVADSGNDRITKGTPLATTAGPRLSVIQPLDGTFTLQFPSSLGFTYGLLHKTYLNDPVWDVVTNWFGTGATIEVTEPTGPAASGFFQLKEQ